MLPYQCLSWTESAECWKSLHLDWTAIYLVLPRLEDSHQKESLVCDHWGKRTREGTRVIGQSGIRIIGSDSGKGLSGRKFYLHAKFVSARPLSWSRNIRFERDICNAACSRITGCLGATDRQPRRAFRRGHDFVLGLRASPSVGFSTWYCMKSCSVRQNLGC